MINQLLEIIKPFLDWKLVCLSLCMTVAILGVCLIAGLFWLAVAQEA